MLSALSNIWKSSAFVIVCMAATSCSEPKRFYARDASMEPRITARSWVDYSPLDSPEALDRWTVVVVREPSSDRLLALRVVGLPGETVWLDHHGLRISGETVRPPMLSVAYRFDARQIRHGGRTYYQIPPDSYYLLGDNTAIAVDSRHFGAVPRDRIVGVVDSG